MKATYMLTLLFFIATFGAIAQSNTAMARIFENSSKDASQIFVVYDTGEEEIIPLKNIDGFGMAKTSSKVLIENQKTIFQFLQNMEEKGFQIAQMSSSSEAFIYTFILFTKED